MSACRNRTRRAFASTCRTASSPAFRALGASCRCTAGPPLLQATSRGPTGSPGRPAPAASRVPGLGGFVPVPGDAADLEGEVGRLNGLLGPRDVDVCFAGIGENCHLAFNDPPADFSVDAPYIVVALDEACRRQQMGEGWVPTLDDVPGRGA